MGFASYHEDILKRHESDVHEFLRELEAGHLGVAQQRHVLPEFKWVLDQLRSVLSDPTHPIAVRLLELRSQSATLENDVRLMTEKRDALSQKNSELNERERAASADVIRAREEGAKLRSECETLKRGSARLESKVTALQLEVGALKTNAKKLEKALLEAQVDVRY